MPAGPASSGRASRAPARPAALQAREARSASTSRVEPDRCRSLLARLHASAPRPTPTRGSSLERRDQPLEEVRARSRRRCSAARRRRRRPPPTPGCRRLGEAVVVGAVGPQHAHVRPVARQSLGGSRRSSRCRPTITRCATRLRREVREAALGQRRSGCRRRSRRRLDKAMARAMVETASGARPRCGSRSNLVFLVPGETGGMEVYARELIPRARGAPRRSSCVRVRQPRGGRGGDGPWGERRAGAWSCPSTRATASSGCAASSSCCRGSPRARGVDLVHSLASTAPLRGRVRGASRRSTTSTTRSSPRRTSACAALGMRVLVPAAARRSHRIIVDADVDRATTSSRYLGTPRGQDRRRAARASTPSPRRRRPPSAELRARLGPRRRRRCC